MTQRSGTNDLTHGYRETLSSEYPLPHIHTNMSEINCKNTNLENLFMKAVLSGSLTCHKSCQTNDTGKFANQIVHCV